MAFADGGSSAVDNNFLTLCKDADPDIPILTAGSHRASKLAS